MTGSNGGYKRGRMVEVGGSSEPKRRAFDGMCWMLFAAAAVIALFAATILLIGKVTVTDAEKVEVAARDVGADAKLALLVRLAGVEGWGGVMTADWTPERIVESLVFWQREFTMNRELQVQHRTYGYPFIAYVSKKLCAEGRWMEVYWQGRGGIGQLYALDIRDIRGLVIDGYWVRDREELGREEWNGKDRRGTDRPGTERRNDMTGT